MHYVATKIGRGELAEAADSLAFIRGMALGPLALASRGARPMGVRKLEIAAPDLAAEIAKTVAPCERHAIVTALEHAIAVYRTLCVATASPGIRRHAAAEVAAMEYVREIATRWEA